MNKIFSRLILWFTALSAVFFTTPAFALWSPSPLISASNPCVRYPMAFSPTKTTSPYPVLYNSTSVNNSASYWYIDTSDTFHFFHRVSTYVAEALTIPNVECSSIFWDAFVTYIATNSSWQNNTWYVRLKNGNYKNISVASNTTLTVSAEYSSPDYFPESLPYSNGKFLPPLSQSYPSNWVGSLFYISGSTLYINNNGNKNSPTYVAVTLPWNAVLPVYCWSDNIASGGTCSCKPSTVPTASSSSGSAMTWEWDWTWSITTTTKTSSGLFSDNFSSYSIYKVNSEWWNPNDLLGSISVYGGVSHADPIVFSNTGGVVWSNNYISFSSDWFIEIRTEWKKWFSTTTDNLFSAFYINSSSGSVTSSFEVYYGSNGSSDPTTYLWIYNTNQLIVLPSQILSHSLKIVPTSSSNFYVWGVSLWSPSYSYDNICTNLSASGALAELASRSTLSGSTNIANVNFCGSAFDVPYIGSALGAMCNFVQPLIKPLVWGFQTTVDMINIVPPSTTPTTFDYYPSFTFSGMTMHISTQTGAIPVYSSGSDVNPLKITSNEASSNMKIWVLALISIILYLVVYALHFWIVAGLVWLLLHISRFFTGFLWKHSGTGNIWSLAPFLVYAWVFFTALLSIIASVSFILPLLQVIRAYALFLITWLTSFAPWSYALFSGFYIVVFSSIFLVGTFYLIYVLFEKHSRLN